MMIWIWLGMIILFGVVEAATAGLVSIWFVAGSVAALLSAILDASTTIQIAVFLVVSILALAATRPLVRKLHDRKAIPTNLDRVLGLVGRVTEPIDNKNSTGAVYVDGKTWTARSSDNSTYAVGELVIVQKIEGVTLFVEKTTVEEDIKK